VGYLKPALYPVFFLKNGVVEIKSADLDAEILERVVRIEDALAQGLRDVQEKLGAGQETFRLFKDGLSAYKDRTLKETGVSKSQSVLNQWNQKILSDRDLRFPHRKILEFLLSQFDFQKNQFKEVHFSRLVKEAHVGKNKATEYLSLLEQKGYVQIRDDGYRIFFRIRG